MKALFLSILALLPAAASAQRDTLGVLERSSVFSAEDERAVAGFHTESPAMMLYRSEQSRNRKSGGSGIGLALAQQFIRSHGGNIWADSTVGKGTTFTFILPLKADI